MYVSEEFVCLFDINTVVVKSESTSQAQKYGNLKYAQSVLKIYIEKTLSDTVSVIILIVPIWQVAELLSALSCWNGVLQIINSVIAFIHDLHGGM